MREAQKDLQLRHLFIVYPGTRSFPVDDGIDVVAFTDIPLLPDRIKSLAGLPDR